MQTIHLISERLKYLAHVFYHPIHSSTCHSPRLPAWIKAEMRQENVKPLQQRFFFFLFRRFYRRIHRRIEPRHDSPGFSSNLIAILRRLIESTTTKSLFAHLSNIGVRLQVEFP